MITRIQTKNITIGNPVEIDGAINTIRTTLDTSLSWISHPYLIAQRFIKTGANNKTFMLPEVYARNPADPSGKYEYKTLTPDNDFSGMMFAYVPTGVSDTNDQYLNYLTYNVAFIFCVNLELIDATKLNNGLYTRELMRDVRRTLSANRPVFPFQFSITQETDDLRTVFREFVIDDLERYNRAPLQCFRFDLSITIQEECD